MGYVWCLCDIPTCGIFDVLILWFFDILILWRLLTSSTSWVFLSDLDIPLFFSSCSRMYDLLLILLRAVPISPTIDTYTNSLVVSTLFWDNQTTGNLNQHFPLWSKESKNKQGRIRTGSIPVVYDKSELRARCRIARAWDVRVAGVKARTAVTTRESTRLRDQFHVVWFSMN